MAWRELPFKVAIREVLAIDGGTGARIAGLNTWDKALSWRIALYVKSLGYTRVIIREDGVDVDRWSKVTA